MKKNGFALIETVVVVVVLTSSLLLLYTSFNKILQSEKTRINYDDINYIYRTWYIKNVIDSVNINIPKSDLDVRPDFFVIIDSNYNGLFNGFDSKKVLFEQMIQDYEVNKIILLKTNKIDNIKRNDNLASAKLSDNMIEYLKTLIVDLNAPYTLVIEYETCNNANICHNYYGWVGV